MKEVTLDMTSRPGCPSRRCQSDIEESTARAWALGSCKGYNDPKLLHLRISFRDARSFTEQPAGSNSTTQLLSIVNWRIEIIFLISLGETKTLLRDKDPVRVVAPVAVTGSKEPSLTTMEEGKGYREEAGCERVRGSEVI